MLNRQPTSFSQQVKAMSQPQLFGSRSQFATVISLCMGFATIGGIAPTALAQGHIAHPTQSPLSKQTPLEDAVQPGFGRRQDFPLGGRSTETVLDEIQTILAREEPPLGSRGAVCAVSPGLLGDTDTIWSDRPTFLWQGSASQIRLYNFDTPGSSPIWQADLEPGSQSIAYSGEAALQPGQVYAWDLADEAGSSILYIFAVMAAEERSTIAADLQALELQLKASNASEENMAAEQARYFADLGLWSDVLQALQQIETPSASVIQMIQEISDRVCVSSMGS
ncbi:MAG: DUF928 domain-containing protein [Leptolyngbyaceae cyanobacterium SL_7_1]|nr:DUF928 domain-containing protein [Leptolyngbyaceae cyanobacterium SL_7_1]